MTHQTLIPAQAAPKRKRYKSKPRKKAELPQKNYTYSIWRVLSGEDEFDGVVKKMHVLRNEHVRKDRTRREGYDQARRTHTPGLIEAEEERDRLKEELDELETAVKRTNAARRSRRQPPEVKARLAELRKAFRAAKQEVGRLRGDAKALQAVQDEAKRLNEEANDRQQALRKPSGLWWCNYLDIENAAKQFGRGKVPPKFRRYDACDRDKVEGKAVIQLQKPTAPKAAAQKTMTLPKLFGGQDHRLKLVKMPPRGQNGCHDRNYELSFTLRTEGWGKAFTPIYFKAIVYLHRDIPAGSVIKWARLFRLRRGLRYVWKFQLVVENAAGFPCDQPLAPGGRVGVDLGWWKADDAGTRRVAYWYGDDGREGTINIPAVQAARWALADEMRSERKTTFNRTRDALLAWLVEQQTARAAADSALPPLPEWLAEARTHMAKWESQLRLRRLTARWERERFAGDDEALDLLRPWMVWDRKQANNEASVRAKACQWRDNYYHHKINELRACYRTVFMEEVGTWAKLAAKSRPKPGEDRAAFEEAARARQMCAPGRFAALAREKFPANVQRPATKTTIVCCDCGKDDPFDAAAERVRTCAHCGSTRDQDQRAAINLLNGIGAAAGPAAGR